MDDKMSKKLPNSALSLTIHIYFDDLAVITINSAHQYTQSSIASNTWERGQQVVFAYPPPQLN